MMNPLLLAASLAQARRGIGDAVNQTLLGAAAYGVLVVLGAVALAFFTAAGFLHLAGTFTTVLACVIIAAESDPLPGSERQKQPSFFPDANGSRKSFFWSSVP